MEELFKIPNSARCVAANRKSSFNNFRSYYFYLLNPNLYAYVSAVTVYHSVRECGLAEMKQDFSWLRSVLRTLIRFELGLTLVNIKQNREVAIALPTLPCTLCILSLYEKNVQQQRIYRSQGRTRVPRCP